MKKILSLLSIIILLSLASVSAHKYQEVYHNDDFHYKERFSSTEFYDDEKVTIVVERYADYDNDDRYTTYDYRHGYSYRETKDYWDRKYWDVNARYDNSPIIVEKHPRKKIMIEHPTRKNYYYRYNTLTREYDAQECYNRPPHNKIFYIKCP